jgi:hypothetical protein
MTDPPRLEDLQVSAAELDDAELRQLAALLSWVAARSEQWSGSVRLLFADLAAQCHDLLRWRAVSLERLEVELRGEDWI